MMLRNTAFICWDRLHCMGRGPSGTQQSLLEAVQERGHAATTTVTLSNRRWLPLHEVINGDWLGAVAAAAGRCTAHPNKVGGRGPWRAPRRRHSALGGELGVVKGAYTAAGAAAAAHKNLVDAGVPLRMVCFGGKGWGRVGLQALRVAQARSGLPGSSGPC